MDDELHARRVLRQIRSEALEWFGRDGHRPRTFMAAMEQSEELWTSSRNVAPTASPIIQFYALTQGATALLAFCARTEWQPKPRHGITVRKTSISSDRTLQLDEIKVSRAGKGFVHQMAELLGSPVIAKPTSLSELMCALPDTEDLLLGDVDRRPVKVSVGGVSHDHQEHSDVVSVSCGPLPPNLYREQRDEDTGLISLVRPSVTEVERWLRGYPTLGALGVPQEVLHVNPGIGNPKEGFVAIKWLLGENLSHERRASLSRSLVDIDDGGWIPNGVTLPAVGGNAEKLHPLISWWLMLFVCSVLARYHPRSWVRLLDVDRSNMAVPLETLLDVSRTAVPKLMAQVLLDGMKESAARRDGSSLSYEGGAAESDTTKR